LLFIRTHALEGKIDNQDEVPQSAYSQRRTVKIKDY